MKIINIVGARPNFMKIAPIISEMKKYKEIESLLVHTGQHYDENMSKLFFDDLVIPRPDINLNVGSASHAVQTANIMIEFEKVCIKENPDYVLVVGDVNSTIACALVAKKLGIKVIHIEAGLRSFDMKMPEEINRILTDRISDILFCPSTNAVENLKKEGFDDFDCKIIKSGDVMLDAVLFYKKFSKNPDFKIPQEFILSTIHRAENTDDSEKLYSMFSAFNKISKDIPIILPLHPRTRKIISNLAFRFENSKLYIVSPVGYLEMLYLLENCSLVMTDSGGLQKEAFFFKKPCVTLRNETEWIELVENGFNEVVGTDKENIIIGYKKMIDKKLDFKIDLYGNGKASRKILKELIC
ncbi:MAG: UDP-N-acetylglucosamine 2-epimerase (non-hydrolyzing) [Candidatus Cloacimonetes bacterium]|nr:UDP-N-acetylglucosamine 2-epimerase (non-hydrolyzing) [Candidatus Cloacimonadota bacterium]MBL7086264.1 UDP-N-acetylglucosamine 2-epimerase (non-hydrolyzing) [Candidatus Cloacimonadota bacterium]